MKVISSCLGHRKATVTLDIYGHLFDRIDEQAADALDTGIQDAAVPFSCHEGSGDVAELPGA